MSKFEQMVKRGKQRFPKGFDTSHLVNRFIPYYESGERIKVQWPCGMKTCGTVGVTTGWKPAFLLMRRSSDIGSSLLLGEGDYIVAVKRGSKYEVVM